MSIPDASTVKKISGVRTVLQYTGIPVSWLSKRPKLPSRNWLIFLGVTSSITGYYLYDRRECKRIRQQYVDKVHYLAEQIPKDHFERPRKVAVYGCKWPGDEDHEQAIKYFKKYIKPILVAAAVDYDTVNGKRHGDLANMIADEIKSRRRQDAGLDPFVSPHSQVPNLPYRSPEEVHQQELAGGIVIVGRPAWKEFLSGLKRGWTEGLEKVDKEELLAQELEQDGHFDEPEDLAEEIQKKVIVPPPSLSPFQLIKPRSSSPSTVPEELNIPPSTIRSLPPILLVPFIDYIGFRQIPIMIWDWFNQRHKVLSGAQAAYRLVMGQTRPIEPPQASSSTRFEDLEDPSITPVQGGDLDFDMGVESYYHSRTKKTQSNIEKARKEYYDALPAKLKTARELARGDREPTKDERNYPPKTEVELRSERMEKEKRWRGDAAGWEVVRNGKRAEWDERFGDIRVFVDPSEES